MEVRVRLPPVGSWGWKLVSSLVNVELFNEALVERDELIVRDPRKLAAKLRELRRKPFAQRGPRRAEKDVVDKVVSALGIGVQAKALTLGHLAERLAEVFERPRDFARAFEDVEAVSMLRAEYYKYTRSFGGYSGVDALEDASLPAAAQALALLAYEYTLLSQLREDRRPLTMHLLFTCTPEETRLTGIDPPSLYGRVKALLSRYLEAPEAKAYGVVLQLLASIASASSGYVSLERGSECFATALVQPGGKRFTLVGTEPLPVLDIARMFVSSLGAEDLGLMERYVRAVALASANARCSIRRPRVEAGKIAAFRGTLAQVLVTVAQNLANYARTGDKAFLYAASRIALQAANTDLAGLLEICGGECVREHEDCKEECDPRARGCVSARTALAGLSKLLPELRVPEVVVLRVV